MDKNMADKKRIVVYLDPSLYEKIEEERGLVKRSTFVEDLIKERLKQ